MGSLWNRLTKAALLSMIVLLYIIMGLSILKKKPPDSEETRSTDASDMKTLVGYSMEYKISEDQKEMYVCDSLKEFKVKKVLANKKAVNLVFDKRAQVYVLSAFYDARLEPYVYIRAVALMDTTTKLYCQIWNEDNIESEVHRATVKSIWAPNWDSANKGTLEPALLSCLLTGTSLDAPPTHISFTPDPCGVPERIYPVQKPEERTQKTSPNFVVCVKPVKFDTNINETLKEWVQLNNILGASKIIVYYLSFHSKNLEIVKSFNFVELRQFKSPVRLKSKPMFKDTVWLKRKLEILAYNDCFYRHLNDDFVIPLDIDEVIVPKKGENWEDMFKYYFKNDSNLEEKLKEYSSFSVRNAYFFSKYPQNALIYHNLLLPNAKNISLVNNNSSSIFSRELRSFRYSPSTESAKSFVYVPNTLSVFNHFTFDVLRPSVRQMFFPTNIGQLNHYRQFCDNRLIENCQDFLYLVTHDDTLSKFRDLIHDN